jgi:hypothetical protein
VQQYSQSGFLLPQTCPRVMAGALSGFTCFGFPFGLAGCLVVAFAWGVAGAPLRVASHPDTAAGVARSRAAMASTSALARILSLACFTRAATVSTLVVGRPLKVTPFPVAWILVVRVGLAGLAGVAGLVAARLVPDGFTVAWSTDFADAGVRSSRPAARSLASWSALTCRAMSSNGFGLAVVALDADSRPFLALCRPDAGWVPLEKTYQRASWAPWRAFVWWPSVVVLPCWEPHACLQGRRVVQP